MKSYLEKPGLPFQSICPMKRTAKSERNFREPEAGAAGALNAKNSQNNTDQEVLDGWKYFAFILDRCFFILSVIFLLIFNIIAFPSISALKST